MAIVGVAAYRVVGLWHPEHFRSVIDSLQLGLDVLAVALVWGTTFVAIQTAMVGFQGKPSDIRTAGCFAMSFCRNVFVVAGGADLIAAAELLAVER
jgi:hypothetical protein